MFRRFDRIPSCDWQTDGQTDILRQHSRRAIKTRKTINLSLSHLFIFETPQRPFAYNFISSMHCNLDSSCRPQRNGLSQRSVLSPVLFKLYSNDLPVTRGRKFIYADDMSRHSRRILQRTGLNAVSRQIWRRCHTSVDSSDLSQAPPKQSAVCSTCIIQAPPTNCQFIWMASAATSAWVPPNLSWWL